MAIGGIGGEAHGMRSVGVLVLALSALVLGMAVAPPSASAGSLCTDPWRGLAEGHWSTATNSSAARESSSDVACIPPGETAKVSAVSAGGTAAVSAGTLADAALATPSAVPPGRADRLLSVAAPEFSAAAGGELVDTHLAVTV